MRKLVTAVVVAASCAVAGVAAAPAVPAWGSTPGKLVPRAQVVNLHAAYLAHLGHTKPGRIAGITYPLGKEPMPVTSKANGSCTEPDCPLVDNGGSVQHSPHVWLLLWGPAWSTDSGQEASATYLESFYAGLGAKPDDSWSTTTDQYSDSSGNPSFFGSVYQGAFQDTSTPPSGAVQSQIAAEADAFASTHGITDLTDAQIIVATQSGTCPSGFACGGNGNYCAWHSSSNEPYTNLPYILDGGSACGENFVNAGSAGTYDGFSIVAGHEYAETITDPYPTSGWWDSNDLYGGEIGDKCAWGGLPWGDNDPYGNVTLSTGSFAMQSLWSNSAFAATGAGCVMSTPQPLTITSVQFLRTVRRPLLVVNGSGFGPSAPSPSYPVPSGCGSPTGTLYGSSFSFQDSTSGWGAGAGGPGGTGNCVGLLVQSWTNDQIVFGFGSAYDTFGWRLASSDTYSVSVYGTTATPAPGISPAKVGLSLSSGAPYAAVTASGTGFAAGETVAVGYETGLTTPKSVTICKATVASNGAFSCGGHIPKASRAGALGPHAVIARGSLTKLTARTTFSLT